MNQQYYFGNTLRMHDAAINIINNKLQTIENKQHTTQDTNNKFYRDRNMEISNLKEKVSQLSIFKGAAPEQVAEIKSSLTKVESEINSIKANAETTKTATDDELNKIKSSLQILSDSITILVEKLQDLSN